MKEINWFKIAAARGINLEPLSNLMEAYVKMYKFYGEAAADWLIEYAIAEGKDINNYKCLFSIAVEKYDEGMDKYHHDHALAWDYTQNALSTIIECTYYNLKYEPEQFGREWSKRKVGLDDVFIDMLEQHIKDNPDFDCLGD